MEIEKNITQEYKLNDTQYEVLLSKMTLENYIKFYNETMYPLNYPYKLKIGLRCVYKNETYSNKVTVITENILIVQIGIPIEIKENKKFNIDAPTEYIFQDILTIKGESDKEIIKAFEAISFDINHKEYFKKMWNK